jgi:hypothetical protein
MRRREFITLLGGAAAWPPTVRTLRLAAVVTFLSLLSQSVVADEIATFQGIGPARLGMTAATVERVLHSKLEKIDLISGDDETVCWIGRRTDGVDPEMSYMFEEGKLTRIDVSGNSSRARTLKNIGINSTENEVRRIYRNRIAAKPAGIDADIDVIWMAVNSLDKHRSMTFEVRNGKVVSFWTAMYPAAEYYEGCL